MWRGVIIVIESDSPQQVLTQKYYVMHTQRNAVLRIVITRFIITVIWSNYSMQISVCFGCRYRQKSKIWTFADQALGTS